MKYLLSEQPEVSRTLLKVLNNKTCQRALETENQPSLFDAVFYAWNNLPTPTPTSITQAPSLPSEFTLSHFSETP